MQGVWSGLSLGKGGQEIQTPTMGELLSLVVRSAQTTDRWAN